MSERAQVKKNMDTAELTYKPNPTKEDLVEYFGQRIAVRKMTPKEAFRLMGVSDPDIEKIQAYPFRTYAEREEYLQRKQAEITALELEKSSLELERRGSNWFLQGIKAPLESIRRYRELNKRIKEIYKDLMRIKSESICKTVQYKMAGNSIVVQVLEVIFPKLFIDTTPNRPIQASLFD